MPEKVDLRQLIQDRKQGENRGTVRQRMCLDPDLLPELNELLAERESRDDDAPGDNRYGRGDALSSRIRALESRVAEVSVQVVFRLPSRAKLAEYTQRVSDGDDNGTLDLDIARDCFDHFESLVGERLAELGQDDFDSLIDVTVTGEINIIGTRIFQRAMGAPDFPSSALPSGRIRK